MKKQKLSTLVIIGIAVGLIVLGASMIWRAQIDIYGSNLTAAVSASSVTSKLKDLTKDASECMKTMEDSAKEIEEISEKIKSAYDDTATAIIETAQMSADAAAEAAEDSGGGEGEGDGESSDDGEHEGNSTSITDYHHTQTGHPKDGGTSLVLCPGQAKVFTSCKVGSVNIPYHNDNDKGRHAYWNQDKVIKGTMTCTGDYGTGTFTVDSTYHGGTCD